MDDQYKLYNDVMALKRKHHIYVVHAICMIIYWYEQRKHSIRRIQTRTIRLEGEKVRADLMDRIMTGHRTRSIIRMNPKAFMELCDLLIKYGGLRPTVRVSVEEQVVKSLYLLSHSVTNRELSFFFYRSGETVSQHFHNVLNVIIELEDRFIKQPDGVQVPIEILNNDRFFPYFKDCIGAIDGTHIRVKVSSKEAAKYRGRKEHPTQNVLAACTFDLKFTYVLPRWEGTASDSRIIKNALSRENRILIPEGKFYLVDAGFMLKAGLITPYRGERYHLKEYSRNPPKNPRELFNLRHSSLRNAIERAFGVLKKRFPIIASSNEPNYCVDPDDDILAEVDRDLRNQTHYKENHVDRDDEEDAARGEFIRDIIASHMWSNFIV